MEKAVDQSLLGQWGQRR